MKGRPVRLRMSTVGGETKEMNSALYDIAFIDKIGQTVEVMTLGIDRISTTINVIDLSCIEGLFQVNKYVFLVNSIFKNDDIYNVQHNTMNI